ncbi:MAG: sugar ABC transporter ATP-binding protein [Candidatus Humimicrobiaceae bacterium]
MSEYILEMLDISKEFPGVKALNKVNFRLRPGTVHALVGENGAGKSTLMKCLIGINTKDSGGILIDGREINILNPYFALKNGIAMIHQELSPIYDRNVMENIWLGREPMRMKLFVDHKKMYKKTKELLIKLNIEIDPKEKMSNLTVAKMQMIEIAKAISYNARILIMDEPTSALTGNEVNHLFSIICELKANGVAIVYISHKMDEIFKISDDVTILRDGEYISTDGINDLTINEVITRMVGRQLKDMFPKINCKIGDTVLKVENLSSGKSFQDVSFELRKGEILGISGLVGAGRTELIEALFGLRRVESGTIWINGQIAKINNPMQAKKHKLGLLTEDRRKTGIIPVLPIFNNMLIAAIDKYTNKSGFIRRRAANKQINSYMSKLRVKAANTKILIQNLSGGNQQKVLVARWLLACTEILFLDEPTRGIDVGSKADIYAIITSLANEGKSILIVSSEMPEIIGMCDRVLVMRQGKITGILNRDELNQEILMSYAAVNI